MLEFTYNGIVRHGFGFCNPNHAAALICMCIPFCYGWRKHILLEYMLFAALAAMLAMTYSRTGLLVFTAEIVAMQFAVRRAQPKGNLKTSGVVFYIATVSLATYWILPRMCIDGAIANRPKIWFAGLELYTANFLGGVGFGNSGNIVSTFMLTNGINVRTLVNSHLTLIVELGIFAGFAWIVFIVSTLLTSNILSRTWISFAGMSISSFASSVFDWHILFDFADMGGLGLSNFILSWLSLVSFIIIGVSLICRGFKIKRLVCASIATAILLVAPLAFWHQRVPRVSDGYVSVGKDDPTVYRDGEWTLKAVCDYFPQGARYYIPVGVPPNAERTINAENDVWLFGSAAESSARLSSARISVVAPPEFYERSPNVVRVVKTPGVEYR